jgi:ATP-dependent Lon protease
MDIFLFPMVNVTLFPKTTKPLPIFEPRYVEMFRDSARTQTPVAIGFNDNPSTNGVAAPGSKVSFVREMAGYGTSQIIEERPNGSLLVFVHGMGKVKLGNVKDTDTPYIVCEAEIVHENTQVTPDSHAAIQGLNNILARWIHTHIPDPNQREIFLRNLTGPEEIIGAFSSYLIKDFDFQQIVLEMNDINEKIQYLKSLAESQQITI